MTALFDWFEELRDDFGASAPDPKKYDSIIKSSEQLIHSTINSIIGRGDNGISLLTSNKTVVKFTIDEKEAMLWNKLINHNLDALAECYGCWNIVADSGPTIVYLVHVEYVPKPLNKYYGELINKLTKMAIDMTELGKNYSERRTSNLLYLYGKVANKVYPLQPFVELLQMLAKHGIHIYDLRSDNFRMTNDNKIKLVDPSVPEGVHSRPKQLVFEQKLIYSLLFDQLYF